MKLQITTAVLSGLLSLTSAGPALAANTVGTPVPASVSMLNSRDLVVNGASESATLQLEFAGAEHLERGALGELLVTRHGSHQHYRPDVYQVVNGRMRHLWVSYKVSGDRAIVNFGNFDHGAPIFLRDGASTRQ
jgi:hypothetical protein